VKPRETLLATEEEWLRATEVQVVVSDIVPLACAAAAKVLLVWVSSIAR
jgi:L-arabinokinase